MGEADRHREYKKVKQRFTLGYDGNAITALFVLNVIFFLTLLIVKVAYFFYHEVPQTFDAEVTQWFQLPQNITSLSERPWTLITFMFTDTNENLMRIIANMLWLWAFGSLLQEMAGNEKIIPIYLFGGVSGALAFIISYYLSGNINNTPGYALLGANCSVLAVAAAATTLSPNHKFFTMIRGGIPIWVLLAVYLIVDLAAIRTLPDSYIVAHIISAVAGFLIIFLLRRGKDATLWMINFYDWFINLFNPYKKRKKSHKQKVFYETGNRAPYKKQSIITQQRVDDKWPHGNEKSSRKIIRIFMDNIARRVANSKITRVKNSYFSDFTEEHVGKFMHNNARKR